MAVLFIICIALQTSYVIFANKKKFVIALICKTLASVCFVGLGYYGYSISNDISNKWFIYGLLFDAIGDVLLGVRNIVLHDQMFLIGTLSFMVGHVFYIVALIPRIASILTITMACAIVIGIGLYCFFMKVCKFSKALTIVGFFYTILMVSIGIMGIAAYLHMNTTKNLTYMFGAILFMMSDTILVLHNFSKRKNWMHPVYSTLYYVGQMLIALSMSL